MRITSINVSFLFIVVSFLSQSSASFNGDEILKKASSKSFTKRTKSSLDNAGSEDHPKKEPLYYFQKIQKYQKKREDVLGTLLASSASLNVILLFGLFLR